MKKAKAKAGAAGRKRKLSRAAGILLVIAGAATFAAALLLSLRNKQQEKETQAVSDRVLAGLEQTIPDSVDTETAEKWESGDPPTLSAEGYSCIGILQIQGQKVSKKLPVIRTDLGSQAQDPDVLPCLTQGDPASGLVLKGQTSEDLTNVMKKTVRGDRLSFTDVYGVTTVYIVETSGYIAKVPSQVEEGLVFYCRTMGGYMVVSCRKAS